MPQVSMHTPLGDLSISEESGVIVSIDWGWGAMQTPTPLLTDAVAQFNAYFDGDLRDFDLPVDPAGTPFQRRVWELIARIPYGMTATYGTLARELASSPRAVGMACGRNPVSIIIPCHRVLASGGAMGGYSGGDGLATKTALLRLEGSLPA